MRYHNTLLFNKEDLAVILGKLNMEDWSSGGTIRGAKAIEAHPNYKQDTPDYDIALILLNETVQFKPLTRPICLWNRDPNLDDLIGTFGTIVGWNKEGKGDLALVAQKLEMPVVSQEACLRSHKVFRNFTSARTFCAGNTYYSLHDNY